LCCELTVGLDGSVTHGNHFEHLKMHDQKMDDRKMQELAMTDHLQWMAPQGYTRNAGETRKVQRATESIFLLLFLWRVSLFAL